MRRPVHKSPRDPLGYIRPFQERSVAKNDTPGPTGQTRRSFLAKMGIGAAALALVGSPLGMLDRLRGREESAKITDFPGEDSIFHPASDPRKDPRRPNRP